MDQRYNFNVMSYNCRGAFSAYPYITSWLSSDIIDILCIQEHHLTPNTKDFLKTVHPNFDASVMISRLHSDFRNSSIRQGGLAILWKKCYNYCITELDLGIETDRLMGVKINSDDSVPIFLINVYLPSTNSTISDYQTNLDLLQVVYDSYFDKGVIIVVGDFNAELAPSSDRRLGIVQNARGRLLDNFMEDNSLCCKVADESCLGPVYTYLPDNNGSPSQIDHVLLAKDNINYITSTEVIDDEVLNTSDHCPIIFGLHLNIHSYPLNYRTMYNWSKCDKYTYSQRLRVNLQSNMHGLTLDNESDIDNYFSKLQSSLQNAMESCVPVHVARPYERPYWDHELGEAHKTQNSYRIMWLQEGRPRGPQTLPRPLRHTAHRQSARRRALLPPAGGLARGGVHAAEPGEARWIDAPAGQRRHAHAGARPGQARGPAQRLRRASGLHDHGIRSDTVDAAARQEHRRSHRPDRAG